MNKVLFVHDGPMYIDDKGTIFGIHYNDKIVDRYLLLGGHVTFLMRQKSVENKISNSLSRITSKCFTFVAIPEFKTIKTYFSNKPQVKKIIYETVGRNDVLVVRMPSASGIIAIQAARKLNKPYLVEMVACTFDAYWNYGWKGKLIAHYRFWKTKRIIKNCTYVTYVTRDFLQNRYPTRGESTYFSDVELLPSNEVVLDDRISKIQNRILGQPLILGTVAAIDVSYKGQVSVIKALGLLKRKGILFHYYLVGQGDPKRLMDIVERENIIDQVRILGPLKHEEIFDFLKKIDVYIQPSKLEGLPRALVEAMSLGLPCLGSNVGGIPELLDENCLFTANDISNIKTKLESIQSDWMKMQSKRNFEIAKEYEKLKLENKRQTFYNYFLQEIKKR